MTDKKATWEMASEQFDSEMNDRKTIQFNRDGLLLEFQIKMLSQNEYDKVRGLLSMRKGKGKNDAELPLAMGEYNRAIIKFGVVSGPEGFEPKNRQHLEKLPVEIRDELARSIEEFASLDEVTLLSFRDAR